MIEKRATVGRGNLIGKVLRFAGPGRVSVKWVGFMKSGSVKVLTAIPRKSKIFRRSVESIDDLILIRLKGQKGRI